jgi:hypothetical protein
MKASHGFYHKGLGRMLIHPYCKPSFFTFFALGSPCRCGFDLKDRRVKLQNTILSGVHENPSSIRRAGTRVESRRSGESASCKYRRRRRTADCSGLNAQAKGLTDLEGHAQPSSVSPLERGGIECRPPKEQTCIARRISQVERTAGAAHDFGHEI